MRYFARIDFEITPGVGTVAEIIEPMLDDGGNEIAIERRYHPDLVKTFVDITGIEPRPAGWWTYVGPLGPDATPGTFTPPVL